MSNRRRAKQSTNGNYLPSQRQRLSRRSQLLEPTHVPPAVLAMPNCRASVAAKRSRPRSAVRILIGGISACGSLSSSGSRTRTPRDGSFAIASKNLSAWTAKPFGRRSGRRSEWSSGRRHSFGRKCSRQCRQAGPTVALCELTTARRQYVRCVEYSQGTLDCGQMLMAQHPPHRRCGRSARTAGSSSSR